MYVFTIILTFNDMKQLFQILMNSTLIDSRCMWHFNSTTSSAIVDRTENSKPDATFINIQEPLVQIPQTMCVW